MNTTHSVLGRAVKVVLLVGALSAGISSLGGRKQVPRRVMHPAPSPSESTHESLLPVAHARAPSLGPFDELTFRHASLDAGADVWPRSEYGSPTDELDVAYLEMESSYNQIRTLISDPPIGPADSATRVRNALRLLDGSHPYFSTRRARAARANGRRGVCRCVISRLNAAWTRAKLPEAWEAIDTLGAQPDYFDTVFEFLQRERYPEFQRAAVRLLFKLKHTDRDDAFARSVLGSSDRWIRLFALEELDVRGTSADERRAVYASIMDAEPRLEAQARMRLHELCAIDEDACRLAIANYDAALLPRDRADFLSCLCERPGSVEALARLRGVLAPTDGVLEFEEVRCMALELVGIHNVADPILVAAVRAGMSDASSKVRTSAIGAIAIIGCQEDLDTLRGLERREANPDCRRALEMAAARLDSKLNAREMDR